MAIAYRIFKGSSTGGPVDYRTVVATTSSLSWSDSALPLGSQTRYGVRAYDTVTGLDDANTDAQVEILVDGSGNDASNNPFAPQHVRVLPGPGGTATVEWSYPWPGNKARRPTGYHVYGGTPSISYGSPLVTVADNGLVMFRAALSGLTRGAAYQVGVRAYNASGEESNTVVVAFALPAADPSNVSSLSAIAGY